MGDERDLHVQVAVLQTNYEHLEKQVTEVAGRVTTMDGKLDKILLTVTEEKAKRTVAQRVISAGGHFITGALTLVAAKFLHIPVNLG